MARVKMSWDWVGDWPIFVYTQFVDNGVFNVKVIKGIKNDQNAGDIGPQSKAWFEYTSIGLPSKNAVNKEAFNKAAGKLNEKYECCY